MNVAPFYEMVRIEKHIQQIRRSDTMFFLLSQSDDHTKEERKRRKKKSIDYHQEKYTI